MMEAEVGHTQASLILREYECCLRCVLRMLYGATSQPTDFLNLPGAVRETPLCPVCCGMLHHPRLCALPPDYLRSSYQSPTDETDRYVLAELLYKMDASDFEYLACQFKLNEPINHMFREHIMWARLYDLVTGCSIPSLYDPVWRETHPTGQITCLFTLQDLQRWRRCRITEKQVWYWIVTNTLSSVLKVPIINQSNEVRSQAFLKSNNLNPQVCNPETVVLSISAILSDSQGRAECEEFLERADGCGIVNIRNHADEMLRQLRSLRNPRGSNSANARDENGLATFFELGRTRIAHFLQDMWQQETSSCLVLKSNPNLPRLRMINLERVVPIVLAGRYVKFSRRLPQTPWLIDSKRKLPSSVEELILNPIKEYLGAGSRLNFTSAGREDVDARCLGLGRPFIVRIEHFEAFFPELVRSLSVTAHNSVDSNRSRKAGPIDLLRLASVINARGEGKVMIRDLQIVSPSDATKTIKSGELQKDKHYRAVCWCPSGGLTTELIRNLAERCRHFSGVEQPMNGAALVWPPQTTTTNPNPDLSTSYARLQFGPIEVNQLTPIRVLHRRTLMPRPRLIQSFQLASFEAVMAQPDVDLVDYECWRQMYPVNELFILHVHCAAGSYVKEFVHGDLGRCVPSLSSLVGRQLDLLALDVCAIDFDWPPCLADPKPEQVVSN